MINRKSIRKNNIIKPKKKLIPKKFIKKKLIKKKKKINKNKKNKIYKKIKKNKKINIFYAGSLNHTIFMENNFINLLNIQKINRVNSPDNATIIVANTLKSLNKYLHLNKKFLIWTHEPYFNKSFKAIILYSKKKIHIMNVYTHNIYINNFYYYPNHLIKDLDDNMIDSKKKLYQNKRKISIFATYRKIKFKLELNSVRQSIGIYGHKLGFVDIYGKNWPQNISKENSRHGKNGKSRSGRKHELLSNYCFNICFENTHTKYYVTEKLWDAIRCYTLPIYKGSSWLYKIFPKNSFIDYNEYKSPNKLFEFIYKLSFEDYLKRLKLCINTYNKYIGIIDRRNKVYNNTLKKLKVIV